MAQQAEAARLLLVDDDEDDYLITRSMLAAQVGSAVSLDWTQTYGAARALIAERRHDLYLVDYRLGEHTGLDLIRDAIAPLTAPVILLTGQGDHQVDLEATELGVTDYLVKGTLDGTSLERSIRYALRHHKAMCELRASEERYALAAGATSDGIWDWDLTAGTVYFSPRWKALLGCEDDFDSGGPELWFDLVHPNDLPRLREEIHAHIAGRSSHFQSEHRIRHGDGSWRWVLSRGVATRDGADQPSRIVGSMSDVTARRHAEQQLIHGALHDPLTGLPNRALFMDRVGQRLQRAHRDPDRHCAVLFIDVDRFKLVNDSLNHAAGDRLLTGLAQRLGAVLRAGDTVARLGGDEFTVLLDEVDGPAEALTTARRLQEAIAAPFAIDGRNLTVTASIGIAPNSHGISADDLLRNADIAMYDAKQRGRGCSHIFDTSMHRRVMSRMSLETELRQAIKDQTLRTFFQPIVDLKTEAVVGLEALARWPDGPTSIPPSDFIPIAEEAGLIEDLGRLVLGSACRALADWRLRGVVARDVTVSVNVSGRQLTERRLIDDLRAALAEAALPGANLVLEITESTLIESPERMRETLQELLAMGVGVELDDFGTGYSSLTLLHHFPGDKLKIDRSFVATLAEREESEFIVRSIVWLAHSLGLRVIAEGIDRPDQIDTLRALGCEYGQGFYFARPLPAAELEEFLTRSAVAPSW
jgi:diguanylate cyclase (GGDEF)-like protein/PAS domain S-box-containing protein